MVTDIIGDFLTRIRNAYLRGKKEIEIPSAKMLISISKILKEEGFIADFKEGNEGKDSQRRILKLELRYGNGKKSVIQGIKRISKPGVRVYTGYRDIPRVLNGLGIVILTTPKGIMTGEKAKKEKIGGELLCEVW
ncbi:30S ribosomal protein S8 [Candidatus Dojkabacteria bacterium]|nr:30S ribosomal protein S8 [Candidatus Dojkabacteria bacterium]